MAFGMHDMRAFAREWLEELLSVGYHGMEESLGLPLKQRSGDFSAPPKPLPLYGDAYPTRIAETGQTIWIRLDGPRSPERGYREISVSDEPLRTDAAIVAALTALLRSGTSALRRSENGALQQTDSDVIGTVLKAVLVLSLIVTLAACSENRP
jgi:hypothetical protein